MQIAKIHDDPQQQDGLRILVDRLWPRGIAKAKAPLDVWMPEVAPSPELRKWWNHDAQRFQEFGDRYQEELSQRWNAIASASRAAFGQGKIPSDFPLQVSEQWPEGKENLAYLQQAIGLDIPKAKRLADGEQLGLLYALSVHGGIQLVYAAHDRAMNHAVVLEDWLLQAHKD